MLGRAAYLYPTDPGGSVFGLKLEEYHIEALRSLIFPWIHDAKETCSGWDKERLFSVAKLVSNRITLLTISSRRKVHLLLRINDILKNIHTHTQSSDLELLSWFVELSHISQRCQARVEEPLDPWTGDSKRLDSVIAIATRMRNDLQPPEPETPKSRACDVCLEEHPIEDFPQTPITANCTHEASICVTAIAAHITASLDGRPYNQLTCPLCPEKLDASDVQHWASGQTFSDYCNKAFQAHVRSDPNFHPCLAPGCLSGQIHEDHPHGVPGKMLCIECNAFTCLRHSIPWHTGVTCSQYDDRLRLDKERVDEEEVSARLIAGTTKICPGCQTAIEKNLGCDHFRCRCEHEFCWQCLASYSDIRAGHREGWKGHKIDCPYHSPRMPAHAPLNPERYLRGIVTDI